MPSPAVVGAARYTIRFADGRSATFIDPDREDPAAIIAELFARWPAGYVVEVIH